jgi:hypothetical protein
VANCAATSKAVCISNRGPVCTAKLVVPAQQQGYTYNAWQAENCVNQVSSAYSDAQITGAEEQAIATACSLVFSGSGTTGSACTVNADCKESDGLSCVVHAAASAGSGSCQVVQTKIAPGHSCSAVDAMCSDGYYCSSTSYCLFVDNTACGPGQPCTAGSNCSAGQCVPKLATGIACTADSDCTDGLCIEGANICGPVEILASQEPFCLPMHQ